VAQYAVLRIDKKHTIQEVAALRHHNERTRPTPNADPARLGENVRLVGSGDWCADVQVRLLWWAAGMVLAGSIVTVIVNTLVSAATGTGH